MNTTDKVGGRLFVTVSILLPKSASCGQNTDEPIVLGAIFSVTGPAGFLGGPQKKTVKMLVEKVNKAGGVFGRPLEVVIIDDSGKEEKTIDAFSMLVEEKEVLAVMGPSRNGNTMAIKDLASEYGIPLVSCGAHEMIVDPVSPWVFKTAPNESAAIRHIFQHMQNNGISKIAFVYDKTSFGWIGLDQFEKLSPEYGIKIVFEERYDVDATEKDIRSLLNRIRKDDNVQAVANWSILPVQTLVPRLMKEMSMDMPLYHSHMFGNIEWAREADRAVDDVIFPGLRLIIGEELGDRDPRKAGLVEYRKDYESMYESEDASMFGGFAYDAFWLIVNAIREVGPDREKVRAALEKEEFIGVSGHFKMSPEDHHGLDMDSFSMLTVKDGKFTLLK